MSHPSHVNNNGYFPSGWSNVDKKKLQGLCYYTLNASGNRALCNIPSNSHTWKDPSTSLSYIIKGLCFFFCSFF